MRHLTTVVRAVIGVGAVLAALLVSLASAQIASANTDTVTNCGGSASTPGSLPAEVALANPGDTITFALSPPCSAIDLTSTLAVSSDLTITGPGVGMLSIDGTGSAPVISVTGGTVAISGLTVTGGGGSVGGGISNQGTLTLSDATVSGNSAMLGGGIYDASGGTLTLVDSTVSGNTSSDVGGGIENDGTTTVEASTVADNTASFGGGGIDSPFATLTVTNSTVADNTATDFGGGIYLYDTAPPHQALDATIVNSTLWGNSAGDGGDISSDQAPLSMGATIVADSPSGNDCFLELATLTDQGYNLSDDASCGFGGTGDLPSTPSGLDPSGPTNNGGPTATIALEPGSAAIDAVSNPALCPATDQRGVTRTAPCDMGAYDTDVATVAQCPVGTTSCTASVDAPTQTIDVTGAKPSSTTASITLTVTTETLSCPHFGYLAPVATLTDTGLESSTYITVRNVVTQLPNKKGVLICYEAVGAGAPSPFLLKKCHQAKPKPPCYQSVSVSGGEATVVLLLPAGDPRYHIGGAKPSVTGVSPTSVAPGKKMTITGSNLSEVTAVTVGGVKAQITKTAAGKVTVLAPSVKVSGTVVVLSAAGSSSSLVAVHVT